jgi:hypothetical protein
LIEENNDELFPIVIKKFSKKTIKNDFKLNPFDKKREIGKIEEIVFSYYKKKGFHFIGYENEPIYDLFFHLCFEKFLLKPNWDIYKNKTLKNFSHLTDHLNYTVDWNIEEYKKYKTLKEMVMDIFSNTTFNWMFSDECLYLNGSYLLFQYGIYYQIFKEEIDDFIDNKLPFRNIPLLMKENYHKVKLMREKYPTLFIWGGRNNTEPLETIYNNLPLELIQFILKKQFEHFNRYRSGFMDCWMWNSENKKLKLIEVKRINEKIKSNQKYWLNIFFEHGVDVSVMRVNFTE